jgi:hypothetical protein
LQGKKLSILVSQNLGNSKKMSKLQLRAFLYQLAAFAILFLLFRYLIAAYTGLTGIWIPMTAFVIGTIIGPKFQAVRTKDGEKLFMKWLFIKGIKEIG